MVYRKVIQDHFQMDINHFLGIPGLSFNIMLKICKVKLELISNPELCDFFSKINQRIVCRLVSCFANSFSVLNIALQFCCLHAIGLLLFDSLSILSSLFSWSLSFSSFLI